MLRLALRVRRADAELVLAELLALVPNGVEEVDVSDEVVEYALYGAPGELPELPALRAVAGGALVDVSTRTVANDWAERWREFHRPLVLGERLCVRPPWEPPAAGVAVDVVIDPGRAFGTGAHPTTRMCLELLLELPVACGATGLAGARRFAAVDLGSGSGVLAIAAAKLGWRPVLALDHDPLSVAATAENAVLNGVGEAVESRRFDLRREPVPVAEVVLANLLAPLLRDWCSWLADDPAARPPVVIASGLLTGEADAIAARFADVGLAESRRSIAGEWAALLLLRAGGG